MKVFRFTVNECLSCIFLCLLSLSMASKVFASFWVRVEIRIVTQTITLAFKLHYANGKVRGKLEVELCNYRVFAT